MNIWIILSLLISACMIKFWGEAGAFLVLAFFVGITVYMDYRNNFRPKL